MSAPRSSVQMASIDQEKETEMTNPPHILTITEATEDDVTEQEYVVECPGVTDRCRMWIECMQDKQLDHDLDEDEWRHIVHGVEHRRIDDRWMVRTETCFVRDNEGLDEAAGDLELPAGVYPVDFDSGDDQCSLSLIRVEAVAQP